MPAYRQFATLAEIKAIMQQGVAEVPSYKAYVSRGKLQKYEQEVRAQEGGKGQGREGRRSAVVGQEGAGLPRRFSPRRLPSDPLASPSPACLALLQLTQELADRFINADRKERRQFNKAARNKAKAAAAAMPAPSPFLASANAPEPPEAEASNDAASPAPASAASPAPAAGTASPTPVGAEPSSASVATKAGETEPNTPRPPPPPDQDDDDDEEGKQGSKAGLEAGGMEAWAAGGGAQGGAARDQGGGCLTRPGGSWTNAVPGLFCFSLCVCPAVEAGGSQSKSKAPQAGKSFTLALLMRRWHTECNPRIVACMRKRLELMKVDLVDCMANGLWLQHLDMAAKLMELREG
jgi:hypothetical protein